MTPFPREATDRTRLYRWQKRKRIVVRWAWTSFSKWQSLRRCFCVLELRRQGSRGQGKLETSPKPRAKGALRFGHLWRREGLCVPGCDQAGLSRKRSAKDVRLGAWQVNQHFPPRARHCVVGEGWRNLWLNITWGWDEFGLRSATPVRSGEVWAGLVWQRRENCIFPE